MPEAIEIVRRQKRIKFVKRAAQVSYLVGLGLLVVTTIMSLINPDWLFSLWGALMLGLAIGIGIGAFYCSLFAEVLKHKLEKYKEMSYW